ncbi:hypothetical protein T484DRAFT_1914526, partial [Baffinella frigidus]
MWGSSFWRLSRQTRRSRMRSTSLRRRWLTARSRLRCTCSWCCATPESSSLRRSLPTRSSLSAASSASTRGGEGGRERG